MTIINNTIVGNTGTDNWGGCGGIHCGNGANVTIANTIVWNNKSLAGGSGYEVKASGATVTISYCDIRNRTGDGVSGSPNWGDGNIDSDPKFSSGYHLGSGSPCINAGNNSAVDSDKDLDGKPRIANSVVDIGAYEKQ